MNWLKKSKHNYLVWLFFLTLSLGQLQRLPFTHYLSKIYFHDLIIIMILIFSLFSFREKFVAFWRKTISLQPKVLLITISFFTLSFLFNQMLEFQVISWLYVSRLILYVLFIMTLYFLYQQKKITLLPQIITTISLIAAWGVLQIIFLPDTRFLSTLGWDDHYYRLISTLFDPNFTGMVLILGLSSVIAFFQKKQPLITFIIFFSVALAATFSRASYLAVLFFWATLVATHFFIKKVKIKELLLYFVLSMICIATTLVLLPKPGGEGVNLTRTSSVEARAIDSTHFLSSIQNKNLFWGNGLYYQTKPQQYQYNITNTATLPDNLIIFVFVSGGLIGVTLITILATRLLRYTILNIPLLAATYIAVFIHSMFNNTLLQPMIFLLIGSISIVLLRKKKLNIRT